MADVEQADIGRIVARCEALQRRHRARDMHAAEVREVRHGNFDAVAPGLFSDDWPRPIVANRIDVYARHLAAALSPLPTVSCQSITAQSDRAREFADKRSKIANYYLTRSNVAEQNQTAADGFGTFGLIVGSVEPNFEDKFPDIILEDSSGFYPVWDRLGRTREVARLFTRNAIELMTEYPEHAPRIMGKFGRGGQMAADLEIKVWKHVDSKRIVMFVADDPGCVLMDMENKLGECTYVATKRPGLDDEIRGTFDDLIWVQLALHAMQTYTLSAAAQSVNAPIAAPLDVTDIEIGPGSIIRSNDPRSIGRVPLNVPSEAFAANETLKDELQYGAIVPEALGGSIDASVVTGKGVQQLMAGYSQQIANAQGTLVGFFREIVQLCFKMDEAYWPNQSKAIQGHTEGTPYKLTYTPAKDIRGDHTVEVQYGGIAGLDPNRGLVFMLQAQGADLVSKDYVRRHLPADINPVEEETKIQIEAVRGSLIQGWSAYIQALPQLEQSGQDPSQLLVRAAEMVKRLEKGEKIEDVLPELFAPEPQAAPAPGSPEEQMMAAAGGGGSPDGLSPAGLPPGLRPGLATRGPGARPDMAMMFAGLTSNGAPNMQAGVSRYIPT